MRIDKEKVVYILEILENQGVLRYSFAKNNHNRDCVMIAAPEGNSVYLEFTQNNLLINPRIEEIDNQIIRLQQQIEKLKQERIEIINISL